MSPILMQRRITKHRLIVGVISHPLIKDECCPEKNFRKGVEPTYKIQLQDYF